MGNCLKTQLKESVNNSTLPVLGKITLECNYTGLMEDSPANFIYIGGMGSSVYFTNVTGNLIDRQNRTFTNPLEIQSENNDLGLKPITVTSEQGIVTIGGKYVLKRFGPHFCKVNERLEDILKYMPELKNISFQATEIYGDFQSLAEYELDKIQMSYTTTLSNTDIRSMINTMATKRNNGDQIEMTFGSGNTASNVPVCFVGTYFNRCATIYFTSDTQTYPHGWYGRNPNGTYYNANDEVIEAPQ